MMIYTIIRNMNLLFEDALDEDGKNIVKNINPLTIHSTPHATRDDYVIQPFKKSLSMSSSTCSNCGKIGHLFYQCKLPFTSYGIILFRTNHENIPELLMIRRKDTFGYIDFVRGKYSVTNKFQIQKCIDEMTLEEKDRILSLPFSTLWSELWSRPISSTYKSEESISCKKFDILRSVGAISTDATGIETATSIIDMVHNSHTAWTHQEWEFPKGRRNFRENDIDCALREFEEETGINRKSINVVENIVPYKEYFIGSNFKSYKHKFYIASSNSPDYDLTNYQRSEVSGLEWKTIPQCIDSIRPYSLEKIRIVDNIRNLLKHCTFYS
jgi:8-oxo-dGTP pyrophosphatase MutT (NUDIX family)